MEGNYLLEKIESRKFNMSMFLSMWGDVERHHENNFIQRCNLHHYTYFGVRTLKTFIRINSLIKMSSNTLYGKRESSKLVVLNA